MTLFLNKVIAQSIGRELSSTYEFGRETQLNPKTGPVDSEQISEENVVLDHMVMVILVPGESSLDNQGPSSCSVLTW